MRWYESEGRSMCVIRSVGGRKATKKGRGGGLSSARHSVSAAEGGKTTSMTRTSDGMRVEEITE